MTLDDFFTLTETNYGLTSPSQVRELVAVMQQQQNEKDSPHGQNNVVDSTRQWSAVATAISATDKKECLDLFVQLDGVYFLDKWLKAATQNSSSNITSVEDSITLLLQALEKLPVNYEKLFVSGILTTVENLTVHDSSKVQDKAQEIYQSWKRNSDCNVEKIIGASSDHEVKKTEDIERGTENSDNKASPVQIKGQESTSNNDLALATCSETAADLVEAAETTVKSLDPPSVDDRPPLDTESCNLAVLESTCDIIIKHNATKIENSAEKRLSLEEESKTSQERPVTSCSDISDAIIKSENEPSLQSFSSNVDKNSWDKGSLCINLKAIDMAQTSEAMDCNGNVDQSTNSNAFSPNKTEEGDFEHPILRSEKSLKNNYNFAKNEIVSKKSSDIELDCGIFDPLEVARQVAMEVEREVVDYKEQSCSSSSDKVQAAFNAQQQPHSPDITNRKQSSASEGGSAKNMENDQDSSSSPMQEDPATSSETLDDAEQTDLMESSQVTETAATQAEINNPEKEVGNNFDLNQEICSEDHPSNQFPTPVSIVSASKAKAASKQPPAPLQFEGDLGWKGSASTSAFRPASPRWRTLEESEKDLPNSKQRQQQVFLDIDLNVAEECVDGESCLATNSRKYEHLELDLNHTSEDDDGPSDWRSGHLFHQSRSHSSLSSVKQQPSSGNFDLNGQPSFFNDSSYLSKLSQNHNVSGPGLKSDDSVISIMGTMVQVNHYTVSQTQPLLNNGQTPPELAFDLNFGRSGNNNFLGIGSVVPYDTHTPVYGYNNIGSGPGPGPVMPFSPTLYGSGGPIPYMVDSRGAPVIPQLVESVSALPTPYAQPPFVLNMNNSNSSNGVGPSGSSRNSFDLNSGMMQLESGSEEPVGFRQFLSSGHVEQMRPNAQSTMSSIGGKRKEPENEWENYPFRHYTPAWKQN